MSELLWPVFEFRPLAMEGWDPIYRYADGVWREDDGETYDLAFSTGNFCLYVELPYQRNIVASWITTHWGSRVLRHPRGNAWHYMLRPGRSDWGGGWDRDQHPNIQAGDVGMQWTCQHKRCANGRSISLNPTDKHIRAGIVRDRETGEALRLPDPLVCMYGCAPLKLWRTRQGSKQHE